jgi:hypothetical protein
MHRYCAKYILEDLKKKMVFIGGPRQVGKTTLSKQIASLYDPHAVYLNWDNDEDRLRIQKKRWADDHRLIIFDELHKGPRWKQWIKGVYDVKPKDQQYLVTGSARLDVYKRGGDSLMGRYHYWRLHPLTIDELPPGITKEEGLKRLLTLGGFPEPFLTNDEREARRWRNERFNRILREDIRDLERVRELQLLSLFIDALRERVSSTISLSNLAQDLGVSPNTTKSWLSLAKRMYICFSLTPLSRNVPRAIHKPTKVYFYDNADVIEQNTAGARLENLVANTLIKRLNFIEDYEGKRCRLYYIRDKDGREVDFAVYIDDQLEDLIEVKTSNTDISSSLKYYAKKLNPKRAIQIVGDLKQPYDVDGIRVTNPIDYFIHPPWER